MTVKKLSEVQVGDRVVKVWESGRRDIVKVVAACESLIDIASSFGKIDRFRRRTGRPWNEMRGTLVVIEPYDEGYEKLAEVASRCRSKRIDAQSAIQGQLAGIDRRIAALNKSVANERKAEADLNRYINEREGYPEEWP